MKQNDTPLSTSLFAMHRNLKLIARRNQRRLQLSPGLTTLTCHWWQGSHRVLNQRPRVGPRPFPLPLVASSLSGPIRQGLHNGLPKACRPIGGTTSGRLSCQKGWLSPINESRLPSCVDPYRLWQCRHVAESVHTNGPLLPRSEMQSCQNFAATSSILMRWLAYA